MYRGVKEVKTQNVALAKKSKEKASRSKGFKR